MRGGAIPVLTWATILLVLAIGNAIWDSQAGERDRGGGGVVHHLRDRPALWLARRDALRRGPPPPETEVEPIPESSTGAVFIGLSVATALFGLAWAKFFLFFGLGMLVMALGRVAVELRSERATSERVRREAQQR